MPTPRRVLALALLAACLARSAQAQAIDTTLWVTNGTVRSVLLDGNTLYIGGLFTQVGPATGGGVPTDGSSGAPLSGFPRVLGTVNAVVSDSMGGWFIGGSFTAVGGVPRQNLAHVYFNNTVSNWNPSPNGDVTDLAVAGPRVYAAGSFSSIGGQTRSFLAALDTATGVATNWNPNPNATVRALAIGGSVVYAGGGFTSIGGQTRKGIAALDVSGGSATPWDPNPNVNTSVFTLALSNTTIYAGGNFSTIGGQSRNRIAELSVSTALATTWNPNADARVDVIRFASGTVYVAGVFTNIGGQPHNRLAALDGANGSALSWAPSTNGDINDLAISPDGLTVYAVGLFTTISGQARNHVAGLDATTAVVTGWNPNANGVANALRAIGTAVYVGGSFTGLGGQTRNHIAALDVSTGAATSWNPNASSDVLALAKMGSTVYAGGQFTSIGGQTRNSIAALDASTGSATSWNPNASGAVQALAVSGTKVYAGGFFTSIGGQNASKLAAIDQSTGLIASGWDWNNAGANSTVTSLLVNGPTLYVSGGFTVVGGQTRNGLAALDATSGLATAWDPNVTGGTVDALSLGNGVVYAGGFFNTVSGQPRGRIAAVDLATGLPTSWNPNANGSINALRASGTTVYVGGSFSTIGGQTRPRLAALDAATGSASAWNPSPNNTVLALAASGASVFAGGAHTGMGTVSQSFLSRINAAPSLTAIVPASGGNAGPVTVTVYGGGLVAADTLRLKRAGQPTIVALTMATAPDGSSQSATFNLAGALAGLWDVVATTPDAQTATLANGFSVVAVEAPQLKVSVVGPTLQSGNQVVRHDRRTAFDLVIENPGNVDAQAVPLWLTGIPTDATLELDFTLSYPPQAGGEPDWSMVPVTFTASGGKYLVLVIPRVPPGTTTRRVYLTVPGASHPPFQLVVAVTPPWVDGNKFRACLAGGGITNPTCMGTQLDAINTYLAANSQLTVLSGIAVWAKNAWVCEGAGSLGAAVTKAQQVLGYLEQPVEQGSGAVGCEDVALARWRETPMVTIVGSVDPNDKLGAVGTLSGQQALPYSIRFENVSTATASAQDVIVNDQLDVNTLELTTVSLDQITFGSYHIYPPPGLSSYATTVDLRPTTNLLVNVAVSLDPFTHVLSWYFNSIDPATGRTPTNTQVGFLPPNLAPPQGEGSVLFTVMPKSGSTSVSNAASILFDNPPATTTPAWLNALDHTPPSSHVLPLSVSSNLPSIPITWTADGSPSDLRDFTIYVSEDGAPYRVWRLNTPTTNDTLAPPQDHHPHNYDFYSVARDQIGNIEAPPSVRDATTQSSTAVDHVGAPRLALEGARPNPARGGELAIWFTLPSAEPASLELLDVAGRRLARREVGSLGPGTHLVHLLPSPAPRAGLYFLRLTQSGRVLRARVAVVR